MPLTPFLRLSQVKMGERYTLRSPRVIRRGGIYVVAIGLTINEKIKKQSVYSPVEHVNGTLLTVEGMSCGESNYIPVTDLEGPWEETIQEAALQLARQEERKREADLVRQCCNILKSNGFEVAPYDYSGTSVSFRGVKELEFLLEVLKS